ncbi:hypothetical protein IAT38_006539 [Cryptococcus sp. DSM 104549]
MELYIPIQAYTRPAPPKPPPPSVPGYPPANLPTTIYAPEGPYTKVPPGTLFPFLGTPAPPTGMHADTRNQPAPSLFGAAGFMVPPPVSQTAHPASTTSANALLIGQVWHPQEPVRMSWVNVWFPPKAAGDRGFGGLLGGKSGKADPAGGQAYPPETDEYSPEGSSEASSPPPTEAMFSMSPLAQSQTQALGGSKRPFSKSGSAGTGVPRPKTSIKTSGSVFVTRSQTIDNLPKLLAEKGRGGGELVRWGFFNFGRLFAWAEEGGKIKEALMKVIFERHPTCHAVIKATASPERVDVLIGFQSGDIVWIDPIIGRYSRINKGGFMNDTPVIAIHPDPRQPTHFLAHFKDNTILRFNICLEDPLNLTKETPIPWNRYFDAEFARRGGGGVSVGGSSAKLGSAGAPGVGGSASGTATGTATASGSTRGGFDDEQEDEFLKWKNEDWLGTEKEKANKDKTAVQWAGRNPVSAIRIGKGKINGIAYSPDAKFLAAISEDGNLRLIDVAEEHITDTFVSYYGPFTCLSWSPDSRILAVGGQDDLITLISPREARVIARCQGHSAFVTCINFDQMKGEGRAYRFGSVGEDGKLILWDFSPAAVHRPRHHNPNASVHRFPGGSTLSLGGAGSRSHLPLERVGGDVHPALPRSEVATLQPVLSRLIDGSILTGVYFLPSCVVTVSRAGDAKFWTKPPKGSGRAGAGAGGAGAGGGAGVGAGGAGAGAAAGAGGGRPQDKREE